MQPHLSSNMGDKIPLWTYPGDGTPSEVFIEGMLDDLFLQISEVTTSGAHNCPLYPAVMACHPVGTEEQKEETLTRSAAISTLLPTHFGEWGLWSEMPCSDHLDWEGQSRMPCLDCLLGTSQRSPAPGCCKYLIIPRRPL